jgi:hypothetical protein
MFESLLSSNTGKQVFAHSAYPSKEINGTLKRRGLKNEIHNKGRNGFVHFYSPNDHPYSIILLKFTRLLLRVFRDFTFFVDGILFASLSRSSQRVCASGTVSMKSSFRKRMNDKKPSILNTI